MKRLDHYWQSFHPITLLLIPLAGLFCLLSWLRRQGYRWGLFRAEQILVPVIVVGNITVGGTGKTPLVVWLAEHLKQQGYRPGIISRGYGGQAEQWPQPVEASSDPRLVGDEPVLLAQRTACPVFVGPNRPATARALLAAHACDIIISDDGLQHYALKRDIEIVVLDGQRGLGNGLCLPAGPLRERRWRLATADLVVSNGASGLAAHRMQLTPGLLRNMAEPKRQLPLASFSGQQVHGVAGIGNPGRFFHTLKQQGIGVVEHPFADHHGYRAEELRFTPQLPLLMTEKDAVKCRTFAQADHWYLEVAAELGADFTDCLDKLLRDLNHG